MFIEAGSQIPQLHRSEILGFANTHALPKELNQSFGNLEL
jgi:hypothetical protein